MLLIDKTKQESNALFLPFHPTSSNDTILYSMAQRSRRIYKELDEVLSDVRSGVTIEILNESDISHLRGTFQGPPDTPYEGGLFVVDIKIPVSMLRYLVFNRG